MQCSQWWDHPTVSLWCDSMHGCSCVTLSPTICCIAAYLLYLHTADWFTFWHNRQGAACPPETSDREIFADVSGKKGKGVKTEKKRRKIVKGKVENWKRKVEKLQMRGRGPFWLFTFEDDENLFWVYQNGNSLPGKNISHREKNQEKWLCPLRKICLLCPCFWPIVKENLLYSDNNQGGSWEGALEEFNRPTMKSLQIYSN